MWGKAVSAAVAFALVGGTAVAAPADPVRQAVQQIVDEGHAPAALMSVRRDGRERAYEAGRTPSDAYVRIGSNTKAFVSVVVLQLVREGKIGLDDPVEKYLPIGHRVTVRQLLQHTSGLPEYTDKIGLERPGEVRHRYLSPHDLLDVALKHPARFPPGARFQYTNTNYVVVGLIVQKVTGRPVQEQIDDRVIRKLGLRETYWPAGEGLRHPYARGVHRADENDPKSRVIDVTVMDPSWAWAAGQLVSTPSDLATFYRRLLAGDLLKPDQLAQMRTTVDTGRAGLRYGLGLVSSELTCGGVYWGHSGGIHGYGTLAGATDDGRASALAQTAIPGALTDPQQAVERMDEAQDRAFC